MNIITQSEIFDLLNSEQQFPVDFDRAMGWWQPVTRKGEPVRRNNLIRKFVDCGDYVENIDYQQLKVEQLRPQGGFSEKLVISMTVDCFKLFGMTIAGRRGREIRLHFLECEKTLKELLRSAHTQPEEPQPHILMPSAEEVEWMRSRQWETDEMEWWVNR